MKSDDPDEYSGLVSSISAAMGLDIEPTKVFVVQYRGSGYLFKESEYEKMLVATPNDFKNRPTLEGVKTLQMAVGVLAKFTPIPSTAVPNEAVEAVTNSIDVAERFKDGSSADPFVPKVEEIEKKEFKLNLESLKTKNSTAAPDNTTVVSTPKKVPIAPKPKKVIQQKKTHKPIKL